MFGNKGQLSPQQQRYKDLFEEYRIAEKTDPARAQEIAEGNGA